MTCAHDPEATYSVAQGKQFSAAVTIRDVDCLPIVLDGTVRFGVLDAFETPTVTLELTSGVASPDGSVTIRTQVGSDVGIADIVVSSDWLSENAVITTGKHATFLWYDILVVQADGSQPEIKDAQGVIEIRRGFPWS